MMFMRIQRFIIPDLFNPKILLEKSMMGYISYMEESVNRIFFASMFFVMVVPIILWWYDKGNCLENTLSII